jgi:hypothetical protein
MGEKMKKIIQLLQKQMYQEAYEHLEAMNYQYTLDSINKDFSSVDKLNFYCYLMYVLSKQRSHEIYILLCEYLYFLGTPFHDVYTVIKYNLDTALLFNPDNYNIMNWIIDVFYQHPDSPYSESELKEFSKKIIQKEPDNERANEILR